MDRTMEYPGAIPLETDLLTTQRNVMIGLGYALQGYLGTGTYVDGFTCVQTTVPSQSVQVTPGQILTLANVDNSAFSSLPADTAHQIIKQGLSLNTQTFTCAAPLTVGYSINYLIEVSQSEVDGTPIVLPYYNPGSPATAWSGPAGAGTTNNTVRASAAVVQIKTGTAATTGAQTTPAADSGFTALFVITVAYGQTTITSTNITTLSTAPFISLKLPQVPAWVQGGTYAYAVDSGTANQMNVTLNPVPPSIAAGMRINVRKIATASSAAMTIIVNGQAAVSLIYADTSPMSSTQVMPANYLAELCFDGTSWRFQNGTTSSGVGSLTANAGEGIAVNGAAAISLNYPSLTNETTQGNGDIWSYYSQADGHHRYLTWLQLLNAVKTQIPVATTTAYGVARQTTPAEALAGASAGTTLPAFTRIEDVVTYVASVLFPATTSARGIGRVALLTEAQAGITTGSYPAFMTPEDVAAYAATQGYGNPFTMTGVGAVTIITGSCGLVWSGAVAVNSVNAISAYGPSSAFGLFDSSGGSYTGYDSRSTTWAALATPPTFRLVSCGQISAGVAAGGTFGSTATQGRVIGTWIRTA